jgi:hypothetical protein
MAALMLLVWAPPVRAQATDPPETYPTLVFLPRTAFHMTAEHLSGDDPRYVWEADFGGELDLVGYGTGRFTFEANYQVILGEEIRAFDPNQGNYILAGAASMRVRGVELAGVLYHQSRHMADRPKQDAIDWNMFGGRVRHWIQYRQARIVVRADVRKTFMHSLVDYSWEVDAGLRSDVHLRPGVGLVLAAGARHLGVDGSRNRGGQTGYRAEGGVRLEGRAGAVELFVAGERRIDPYPLETGAATWFTAGFRLLSRQSGR